MKLSTPLQSMGPPFIWKSTQLFNGPYSGQTIRLLLAGTINMQLSKLQKLLKFNIELEWPHVRGLNFNLNEDGVECNGTLWYVMVCARVQCQIFLKFGMRTHVFIGWTIQQEGLECQLENIVPQRNPAIGSFFN